MKSNRNKHFLVLSFLLMAGCAAEQKKPTQWTVKATTKSEQKIWITRPDGSRQCAVKNAIASPDYVAQQVQSAGIVVFQAKSGSDGKMHAQHCGAPTGRTVELEISRPDLTRALGMGFVTKESAAE